jgi:hypothetical protein
VFSNIVFRVDMSGQVVSPQGVHLAGSFNNWSASANPMTAIGNGVFVDTLALDTTLNLEYKFINGNTFFGQEAVPSSCGVNDGFGGYNRTVAVPATDLTLPLVCFSSCSACVPVSIEQLSAGTMSVYPNPATDQIFVRGADRLEILNLHGQTQLLVDGLSKEEINSVSIEALPAGVYFIRLVGQEITVQRFMKK